MTNKPAYAVEAVDHTLAALGLLTERDAVRLSDMAGELGIGRATAHRLLQMLVYREFARQRPDRAYTAGPALMAARQRARLQNLASWLHPSLLLAYDRLKESVQLQVLSGLDVVSLDSIERPPGERQSVRGTRLPAERTSGGLVLLAQLPAAEVRERFAPLPLLTRSQLDRSLATTRRLGFGYIAGTDAVSVSIPVADGDGQAVAALTCTGPSARLTRTRLAEVVAVLRAVAESARRAHPAAGSQLIEQRRTG
jgi:DNA-binding IclR family transcriptional regulator